MLAAHEAGDCYTRDCVLARGLPQCTLCEEFPCDVILTRPHVTVLDRDWLRWKARQKEETPRPADGEEM